MDVFAVSLYDTGIPLNMISLAMFMGFWVMSIVITAGLALVSEKFNDMNIRHKRNVVTYILQIIVTTVSFCLFTFGLPRIITVSQIEGPFTKRDLNISSIALGLVLYMYVFELVYKTSVNFSLMVHHVLTIVLTCLICFFLWDTMTPAAGYLSILLYSAITEQPVFVALILYRFGYKCVWWFRVAAITGLLFKGAIFSLGFVVLKRAILDVEFTNHRNDFDWKSFMTIAFPIVNVLLFIVQIYSIRVYWTIGEKSKKMKARVKPRKSDSVSNIRTDSNSSSIV